MGPLLFVDSVNDLPNASKILDPIIFADDSNLFFSNCDILVIMFATVNIKLSEINQWLLIIKSLLVSLKRSIHFSIKLVKKDDIQLTLPRLQKTVVM